MAKPGRPSPGLDDYLYWQQRLENRNASGLGIDDFCVAEGVSRSTFYRWVRRLQDGIPDAVTAEGVGPPFAERTEPKFLPVSLTALLSRSSCPMVARYDCPLASAKPCL